MIGRLPPHAITAERPDGGDDAELVEWLAAIVRGAPSLMRVLLTIRALELADWLIMSGAVYQRVLNTLTKRAPDYGVRDYDLGYFDASDISYEAEDAMIRRVAAAFDEPLRSAVQVRNQARVHVWFEGRFGESYTPLSCTARQLLVSRIVAGNDRTRTLTGILISWSRGSGRRSGGQFASTRWRGID